MAGKPRGLRRTRLRRTRREFRPPGGLARALRLRRLRLRPRLTTSSIVNSAHST